MSESGDPCTTSHLRIPGEGSSGAGHHRGLHSPIGSARSELSERELEIIGLVATGLTNQEIAAQLTISKRTVDNHVSNIFTKTGAKNRVALINWAMDNGKICRDGFNCCSLEDGQQGV
jgi:DNA-binding NarL/FixJ family response regulator